MLVYIICDDLVKIIKLLDLVKVYVMGVGNVVFDILDFIVKYILIGNLRIKVIVE